MGINGSGEPQEAPFSIGGYMTEEIDKDWPLDEFGVEFLECLECKTKFPEDEVYLDDEGRTFCNFQCFDDFNNSPP